METRLALTVCAWYIASAICTATTKQMVSTPKLFLTTNQFFVATICAAALSSFTRGGVRPLPKRCRTDLWILALTFTVGMLSLNLALGFMHVSLAMTLRATEPLFTVVLTLLFLGRDKIPPNIALAALMPIVGGAGLSSLSATDFSLSGYALVAISNVAFASRAVIYKQIKEKSGLDSIELFYYICRNGSAVYLVLCVAGHVSGLGPVLSISDATAVDSFSMGMLVVNGICYFTYLQLSIVVLAQVSAITHGAMNAMRRPVTIAASAFWFNTSLSALNLCGIGLACLGSLLYSVARASIGKKK